MPDEWIPISEAVGRLAHAQKIPPARAVQGLHKLGLDGRVSGRIDKVIAPSHDEPQRNVDMVSDHWVALDEPEIGRWFAEDEAYLSDDHLWLGIRVHAGDLERETGKLGPGDYTTWTTDFEPKLSYVSLPEALAWLAFRKMMTEDQVCLAISELGSDANVEVLEGALKEICDLACEEQQQESGAMTLKKRCLEQTHDGATDIIWKVLDRSELRNLRELDLRSALMPPGSSAIRVPRTALLKLFPPEQNIPANRQLSHEAIRKRARKMRKERSTLSIGAAAASIVAELPPNPRTKKPRDQRHIERIIAPIWKGGESQKPPKSR